MDVDASSYPSAPYFIDRGATATPQTSDGLFRGLAALSTTYQIGAAFLVFLSLLFYDGLVHVFPKLRLAEPYLTYLPLDLLPPKYRTFMSSMRVHERMVYFVFFVGFIFLFLLAMKFRTTIYNSDPQFQLITKPHEQVVLLFIHLLEVYLVVESKMDLATGHARVRMNEYFGMNGVVLLYLFQWWAVYVLIPALITASYDIVIAHSRSVRRTLWRFLVARILLSVALLYTTERDTPGFWPCVLQLPLTWAAMTLNRNNNETPIDEPPTPHPGGGWSTLLEKGVSPDREEEGTEVDRPSSMRDLRGSVLYGSSFFDCDDTFEQRGTNTVSDRGGGVSPLLDPNVVPGRRHSILSSGSGSSDSSTSNDIKPVTEETPTPRPTLLSHCVLHLRFLTRLLLPHAVCIFMLISLLLFTQVVSLVICFLVSLLLLLLLPASLLSFATDFWLLLAGVASWWICRHGQSLPVGCGVFTCTVVVMPLTAYVFHSGRRFWRRWVGSLLRTPATSIRGNHNKVDSFAAPPLSVLIQRYGASFESFAVGAAAAGVASLASRYSQSAVVGVLIFLFLLGAATEHKVKLRGLVSELCTLD